MADKAPVIPVFLKEHAAVIDLVTSGKVKSWLRGVMEVYPNEGGVTSEALKQRAKYIKRRYDAYVRGCRGGSLVATREDRRLEYRISLGKNGVTIDKLSKLVSQGLKAETASGKPDYRIREKYIDKALRLLGDSDMLVPKAISADDLLPQGGPKVVLNMLFDSPYLKNVSKAIPENAEESEKIIDISENL